MRGLWPLKRLSASPRDPFFPPGQRLSCCGAKRSQLWQLDSAAVVQSSLFQLLLTIIAPLVQSSLFQLLWFGAACVSCYESDSCSCWKSAKPATAVRSSLGQTLGVKAYRCSCSRAAHLATAAGGTALPATAAKVSSIQL
jgi:hypothetical protein